MFNLFQKNDIKIELIYNYQIHIIYENDTEEVISKTSTKAPYRAIKDLTYLYENSIPCFDKNTGYTTYKKVKSFKLTLLE